MSVQHFDQTITPLLALVSGAHYFHCLPTPSLRKIIPNNFFYPPPLPPRPSLFVYYHLHKVLTVLTTLLVTLYFQQLYYKLNVATFFLFVHIVSGGV